VVIGEITSIRRIYEYPLYFWRIRGYDKKKEAVINIQRIISMVKKYVNEEGLLIYGLCITNAITISLFLVANI
jgi:hypothetical protein